MRSEHADSESKRDAQREPRHAHQTCTFLIEKLSAGEYYRMANSWNFRTFTPQRIIDTIFFKRRIRHIGAPSEPELRCTYVHILVAALLRNEEKKKSPWPHTISIVQDPFCVLGVFSRSFGTFARQKRETRNFDSILLQCCKSSWHFSQLFSATCWSWLDHV